MLCHVRPLVFGTEVYVGGSIGEWWLHLLSRLMHWLSGGCCLFCVLLIGWLVAYFVDSLSVLLVSPVVSVDALVEWRLLLVLCTLAWLVVCVLC